MVEVVDKSILLGNAEDTPKGDDNAHAGAAKASGGVRLTNQVTIEIEGQERPACVAETMSIVYGA